MKTTQHFLVFLKRHALKVTTCTLVVSFAFWFLYNLKRTNAKNQPYHIATCMHQLAILIRKSQLVTYTVLKLHVLSLHA